VHQPPLLSRARGDSRAPHLDSRAFDYRYKTRPWARHTVYLHLHTPPPDITVPPPAPAPPRGGVGTRPTDHPARAPYVHARSASRAQGTQRGASFAEGSARSPLPYIRHGERGWASTNPAVVAGFEESARHPARPKNSRKGPGRPTTPGGYWVATGAGPADTVKSPGASVLRQAPPVLYHSLRTYGLGTDAYCHYVPAFSCDRTTAWRGGGA